KGRREAVKKQVELLLSQIAKTRCEYANVKVLRVQQGIPVEQLSRDRWKQEFPEEKDVPGFLKNRKHGAVGADGAKIGNVDIGKDFHSALEKLYLSSMRYEDMPLIKD
ncbi:unnamed protein product, partial [Amoebophrya sp. A120]